MYKIPQKWTNKKGRKYTQKYRTMLLKQKTSKNTKKKKKIRIQIYVFKITNA